MKSDFTFYERRVYIRSLLLKEKHTTLVRLSYLFGVDKQTIKRDINFLSSRLPLVIKSGNGGGIFLDDKFESHKEYLSKKETNLLKQLSMTLSGDDKLILDSIIFKFSASDGE